MISIRQNRIQGKKKILIEMQSALETWVIRQLMASTSYGQVNDRRNLLARPCMTEGVGRV